jgi:hypothetical protein
MPAWAFWLLSAETAIVGMIIGWVIAACLKARRS